MQAFHLCRTVEQFSAFAVAFMEVMQALGEGKFAEAMESSYLLGEWRYWFVAAAGRPGLLPDQNPVRPPPLPVSSAASPSLTSVHLSARLPIRPFAAPPVLFVHPSASPPIRLSACRRFQPPVAPLPKHVP